MFSPALVCLFDFEIDPDRISDSSIFLKGFFNMVRQGKKINNNKKSINNSQGPIETVFSCCNHSSCSYLSLDKISIPNLFSM